MNSGLCPHSLSRPGVLRIMRVVAELPRWCHKGGGTYKLTRATRIDGAVPQFLKSIRAPPMTLLVQGGLVIVQYK